MAEDSIKRIIFVIEFNRIRIYVTIFNEPKTAFKTALNESKWST